MPAIEKIADQRVPESLETEVQHTIAEARMVLPGIQALFGFQLIAIFNNRFSTALSLKMQQIHLASLLLIAVSIALIMAPAAYHRQAERDFISRHFADYASRLVTIAMLPLLIAICVDVAVVAQVITASTVLSVSLAVLLAIFFCWFWFVLPLRHRLLRQKATR